MAWFFLIVGGLLEVLGVAMIHKWNHHRNWQTFLFLLSGFGGSILFLSFALQTLPMGTSYAIWTGIGACGGALIGMMFFHESKNWKRILFIFMVLGSAIGLKLVS